MKRLTAVLTLVMLFVAGCSRERRYYFIPTAPDTTHCPPRHGHK